MSASIGGQGALANMVLDRAGGTEGSAEYTMFELLQTVLRLGVNPHKWDSARTFLRTGQFDVI